MCHSPTHSRDTRVLTMAKVSQMIVNGLPVPATKPELFGSYGDGREVALLHQGTNTWLRGFILEVALESGFSGGDKPTHFLVKLHVTHATRPDFVGQSVEVYVKTAA